MVSQHKLNTFDSHSNRLKMRINPKLKKNYHDYDEYKHSCDTFSVLGCNYYYRCANKYIGKPVTEFIYALRKKCKDIRHRSFKSAIDHKLRYNFLDNLQIDCTFEGGYYEDSNGLVAYIDLKPKKVCKDLPIFKHPFFILYELECPWSAGTGWSLKCFNDIDHFIFKNSQRFLRYDGYYYKVDNEMYYRLLYRNPRFTLYVNSRVLKETFLALKPQRLTKYEYLENEFLNRDLIDKINNED